MASQTRRYFADNSASYALAIIVLYEYSWGHHDEQFVFGPLDAAAMRAGGLILSGPELDGPAAVLAQVPGLAEYDPGAEERLQVARLDSHGRLGGPRRGA